MYDFFIRKKYIFKWRKKTIKRRRNLRKFTLDSVTVLYSISLQPNGFLSLNKMSTNSMSFGLTTPLSLKIKGNKSISSWHLDEVILPCGGELWLLGKKYLGTGAPYVLSAVKGKCRAGLGMGQRLRLRLAQQRIVKPSPMHHFWVLSLEELELKFSFSHVMN